MLNKLAKNQYVKIIKSNLENSDIEYGVVLNDENEILTVSTYLDGQYNHEGIFIGVPAIINHQGVQEILELNLDKEEQGKLDNSCNVLNDMLKEIESEI